MSTEPQWMRNQSLLVQIAQNFKLLEEENRELKAKIKGNNDATLTRDQQKILKLYSYSKWSDYMAWIDEKLQQSGQSVEDQEQSMKRVLSEILEEPDFEESYTIDKKRQGEDRDANESEVELLAMENGKLRRQNIRLKNKLTQIRALYSHGLNF